MFNTEDEYLHWLRKKWAGTEWEHLEGYARDEVQARGRKYADFEKPGDELIESFKGYHTELLEPWVGSKFFSGGRPRIGLYLREYPLPCLDGTLGLLPGHAGKTKLPTRAMEESVRAVLCGNTAYRTVERALKGCCDVVEKTFGEDFAGDLDDFASHIVFADWVRPFAMFKNLRGEDFDKNLSKRSCHRRNMYKFAGQLFAEEVGPEGLNLNVIIVMGLGMFEHVSKCLRDCAIWPPRHGIFRTLRDRPDHPWKSNSRRLLVLPHPVVPQFRQVLKALGAGVESGEALVTNGRLPTSAKELRFTLGEDEQQRSLMDNLSERLQEIITPADIVDRPKSNYRNISSPLHWTIFLQLQRSQIVLKTTVEEGSDLHQVEGWVENHSPFQLVKRKREKNNNICIGIPNSVSDRELDALFGCLERVL